MSIFHSIISASLSPNTEANDVFLALKLLFRPWEWVQGSASRRVEEWFGRIFPNYRVISFNSGRSALLAILKSFDVGKGDEVMVQAFTCVAVPNSVLWTGAKPIYVDIDNTLNIDLSDAKKKISPNTKAVIVQHTLGIPAQIDKILAFAKEHNLLVIEDCAHSLGATFEGKKLGSFGDAAFFSFGRDKVISSVFGGLAMIQTRYDQQWVKIKNFHKRSSHSRVFWVFQQLLHPVLFSIILPFYRLGVGKVILFLSQRIKLLSVPVYAEEKMAKKPDDFPAKYPNALAQLLLLQFKKLEKYNATRKKTAQLYLEKLKINKSVDLLSYPPGSIYLRFPILVSDPNLICSKAKKSGILLGNWYHNVIDPTGVDFDSVSYVAGSCPKAEHVARHIINLPTNISKKRAGWVLDQLS